MQTASDVQGRLLALVKSILKQNAIAADLEPATLLVDVGLTSMDMVNLMLAVEAEFDFTIPQSDITPEKFQSVATLERLVVSQLVGRERGLIGGLAAGCQHDRINRSKDEIALRCPADAGWRG
jgi:acyl carrier protein